jgi:hypothetical protein
VRISEKFETRLLAALATLISGAELGQIDHEVTAVQYPHPQPDGTAELALGMSVTLACPTMTIGDQVMVTGIFQDPYIDDDALRAKAGLLVAGLRNQCAAANAAADGGAPALYRG